MQDIKTQSKTGAINNAIVKELVDNNILADSSPSSPNNRQVNDYVAKYASAANANGLYGDEAQALLTVEKHLTSYINTERTHHEPKLQPVSIVDVRSALANGVQTALQDPELAEKMLSTDMQSPTPQQSTTGAINNAIVDELVTRDILANPNPSSHENARANEYVADYVSAVNAHKLHGDETPTLAKIENHLTSYINTERDSHNKPPVSVMDIKEALSTGIQKTLEVQQTQPDMMPANNIQDFERHGAAQEATMATEVTR